MLFFCSGLPCPVSIISFIPVPRYGYCWDRGSLRNHRPTLLWWDTPIHCRAKHKTNQTPELQRVLTSWAPHCLEVQGRWAGPQIHRRWKVTPCPGSYTAVTETSVDTGYRDRWSGRWNTKFLARLGNRISVANPTASRWTS